MAWIKICIKYFACLIARVDFPLVCVHLRTFCCCFPFVQKQQIFFFTSAHTHQFVCYIRHILNNTTSAGMFVSNFDFSWFCTASLWDFSSWHVYFLRQTQNRAKTCTCLITLNHEVLVLCMYSECAQWCTFNECHPDYKKYMCYWYACAPNNRKKTCQKMCVCTAQHTYTHTQSTDK